MTKNHYIQIAVMSLVILIASVLFAYYYNNYVAPESYTIGSLSGGDYTELAIKDYLSDDTVLFSQNINDVSFKVENGTATYDYNFDAKEFNGLENNYLIYVNNYIINDLTTNAGVISGTYNLNYQDVNNDTLCASKINISFTFRSLSSVLRVTLPANDLGYLMNYFKSDNFIITLALSPFEFGNKDGEVDEKVNQIINLTNEVNSLSGQINTLNGQISDYVQQIADLTNAGADKDEQIAELQENISTLQNQITSLNSQLSEKNEQLSIIQSENAELLEENTSLNALVTSQQETIASLNQTITQLQNQVSYYEQLLEAYENSDKLIVTFKVDDSAHSVQLVDLNGSPSDPENPVKEGYYFEGWSLNGTDLITPSTVSITDDTTFTAIFTQMYSLSIYSNSFPLGQEPLFYTYIYPGETVGELDYTPIPPDEDHRFVDYQTTGFTPTAIDVENHVMTENLSIYPVFENYISYVTVYDGTTSIYSNRVEKGTVLDLSNVQPLGRDNMRFVGFYTSQSARYPSEINSFPTLSSALNCSNDSYTYYSRYEHLSAGYFELDPNNNLQDSAFEKLYLGYWLDGNNVNSGVYANLSSIGFYASLNNLILDMETGYLRLNLDSATYYYVGNYNQETDSWVFLAYRYSNDERFEGADLILNRVAYSNGISPDLL